MKKETLEAINKAFKALEEMEDLLDNIKADIEQITDTMGVFYNPYVNKIEVLKIIDKYKI